MQATGFSYLDHGGFVVIGQAKAGLDPQLGDRYISMYVNHRSLAMQDDVLTAINQLYKIGESHGLCRCVDVKSCLSGA